MIMARMNAEYIMYAVVETHQGGNTVMCRRVILSPQLLERLAAFTSKV